MQLGNQDTGTPPLTRFFGPGKNRVKGKPSYRRSILVLKPQTGNMTAQSPLFEQSALQAKFKKKSGKCSKCHVKVWTNFVPL